MNRQIISALRMFEKLIDAYCTLDRETGSQLELELRNEIINECRKIEYVIKENK